MNDYNPDVDIFFDNLNKWKPELQKLRDLVLDCGLTEELKWKVPCYTYKGKNIVLIHGFKDYFALLFHKGALLNDAENILIQQTENVQSGRQIRFTNLKVLIEKEATLKEYIYEAIEIEKSGLKVELKKTNEFPMPKELDSILEENADLKSAFYSLTPGRQRAYLLHFAAPKQSDTRINRINKNINRILSRKGLTDCICGLTHKPPQCDGSHKSLKSEY